MITDSNNHDGRHFFYALIILLIIHIAFLSVNSQPLSIDEAQYWIWSKQLAWGYHSKPPMIAFLIRLSTSIFGHSSFGVRIFSSMSYAITATFIYLSARQLYNSKIAFWSGITFLMMPAVAVSSNVISTDPFMLMFCSLAFYNFILGLNQPQKISPWILAGVFIGCAALTKYTGLVFLLSFYLFIIINESKIKLLSNIRIYIPALLTIIILSPNVLWNTQHHFATVSHVFNHNIAISHNTLHLTYLASFLLSQLAVFSPILFPLLCYLIFKRQDWKAQLLSIMSAPMLIAVSLKSIFGKVVANWAALTYIAGTPLTVKFLVDRNKKTILITNLIICALLASSYYVITFTYFQNIIHFKKAPAFYRKVSGWDKLTNGINSIKSTYPNANYLFNDRRLWSELSYYGRLPIDRIYTLDQNTIDQAKTIKKNSTATYIIFNTTQTLPNNIKHSFKKIKQIKTLRGAINGAPSREIFTFIGQNYKG